eukprot:1136586-Pelagomonas_calceolata.AAC.1
MGINGAIIMGDSQTQNGVCSLADACKQQQQQQQQQEQPPSCAELLGSSVDHACMGLHGFTLITYSPNL